MQKSEIKKILNQKYERSNWKNLIKEIFKDTNFFSSPINIETNNNKIKKVNELGFINLSDKKKLSLFEIEVNKEINLGRSKVELRNFTAKFIDQNTNHGVLVIFNNKSENYRFTFCSKYSEITEDGEIVERETSSKRYTYLLGENEVCSTLAERLNFLKEKKKNINLLDVTEAFNVERVSNEFFEKYKELYLKLYEDILHLRKSNKSINKNFEYNNISTEEFAKKFLGQIVFIYFLQKKGWLGIKRNENGAFNKWGSGPKDFLRRLFNQEYRKYNNFFNDILEPFFYTALNTELPNNFFPYLNCKLPFLNGGLFEPIKNYNWSETDITIKNEIVKEILDVFDQFNFTINEEDPFEKEVAIDPEMLGKTFERLLNIKDRKSSGSFYTPREIVKFMNEDALISYLLKNLNNDVKYKDLEIFIKSRDTRDISKFTKIKNSADKIDKLLKNITICDPAVGTGAFVIEMLNLISNIRKKLDFYLNKNRDEYYFKLRTIHKSIYGVDIKQHAIEIAKLRLWLSLVIDEKNYENINALPNLDFKFMLGNSLYKSNQTSLFDFEIFKKIEKLKDSYLLTSNHKKKRELTKEINILYSKLNDNLQEFDYKIYFSEIFEDKNKKGFDIVIGNPPYIRGDSEKSENEISRDETLYKRLYYDVYNGGRTNVFVYFIRKSFDICKENGTISLIVNNKWMTANYGRKLRSFLSQKKINKLINFGDLPIFEETAAYPSILVIDNNLIEPDNHKASIFDAEECIKKELESNNESVSYKNIKKYLINLEKYFKLNSQIINSFPHDGSSWSVKSTLNSSIFVSARKKLKFKFSDKKLLIRRGIVSAANEVYIIDKNTRNKWIKSDTNCKKYLKPYLKGRKVIPWVQDRVDEYIIYADRNFEITKVPKIIKNHLEKNKELLSGRTTVPKSHPWYQLQQPQVGYVADFENKKKIVWRDMSNRSVATIVEKGVYLDATCFYIPIDDKALCAWMHSDFFINYLKTITSSIRGETFRWIKQSIEQIFFYPEKIKKDLEKIYELSIKNSDKGTSELNKLVNTFLEK